MNKTILLLLQVVLLTTLACKNDPKQPVDPNRPANFQAGEFANPTVLAGYWIDLDFCARVSQYGSVLQTMNNSHKPYAYAFTFNPGDPDSVTCFNDSKYWKLPVKYNKDTVELVGAFNGKSIFLNYHSQGDRDMTMFDNSSGRTNMDKFIKSRAGTKDGYLAFTTALNHHLFQGSFSPIGKGAANKVSFTPGGFLQGLKEFDRYEVCTGGDCFVAGQEIDVVTFYDARKGKEASQKLFGYSYNGGNDTLTFFNLVNKNPEASATYQVGSVAYMFARTISAPAIAQPLEQKK